MGARTAVVGAGLGGLAAAIRLAAAGRQVCVFDRLDRVGGKAGELVLESGAAAWRFDTGPSLFTLPDVLDDLFAAAGRRREDCLEIRPLDPITRYWFADGSYVESSPDPERFAASLEKAGVAERKELDAYLRYSRRIWNITHHVFMERSLHEVSDLLRDRSIWKSIARMGRIAAFRSMDAANRSFFRDSRAHQFFNRYATYNGSNPYVVPATLNIIPHVEFGIGGYAVSGGIAAIPTALKKVAEETGVEFRLDEPVTEILTSGHPGPVRGVRTAGGDWPADEVVCNADVTTAYRQLLNDPRAPLARRYARLEPSSS